MGTNECSQPASKSSWDSQDFGDVNMVLKMAHFHKSSSPQWVKDSVWGALGGRFNNTYELLNLRALKFSSENKTHIFQCINKIFCVEFRRVIVTLK